MSDDENQTPPKITTVPCGGCGTPIQAPVAMAKLMERTKRPPFCAECREKKNKERRNQIRTAGAKPMQAPGPAPDDTILEIGYRSDRAPPDPDKPRGFSFKLTPGKYDQGIEEIQLLMRIHKGLAMYIHRKAGRLSPIPRGEVAKGTRGASRILKPTAEVVKRALARFRSDKARRR